MFWESAVEQNNELIMDGSFHMQCNSPSAGLAKLGTLNISNPTSNALQELANEHMSFYGDEEETIQQLSNHRDESIWHSNETDLLPEESTVQSFYIVRKPKGFHRQNQNVQPQQQNNQHSQQPQQQRQQNATNSEQPHQEETPSRGFRVFNSLSSSCSMESSTEDEYMDFLEMESLEEQLQNENNNKTNFGLPSNLNSLISGQIKSSLTRTPEMHRPSVRRCLSLTENISPEIQQEQQRKPETSTTPFSSRLAAISDNDVSPFNNAFCFKRPDPPSISNSPIQTKRYRGDEKENINYTKTATNSCSITVSSSSPSSSSSSSSSTTTITNNTRVTYRKSMSMNDAEIMSALARCDNKEEPDLIGDFSKPFVLPLIEGRHRDLKTISSDTVAKLLNGEFQQQVANYVIIDCRYPYEYEGGHIRGAKNLYTQEQIVDEFLTQQKTEQQQAVSALNGNKRNIIIFHCEFSSERGPRLSRFLRNNDRARNTSSYPTLDYPEIYLLHNGYKEFYELHSELCVPNSYRPMLDTAYTNEYRHFRAKSKSWNGDGLGGATSRLKKSRSRLIL